MGVRVCALHYNGRHSWTPAPIRAAIDAARGSLRRARGALGGEPRRRRRTLRGACERGGAVACVFVCALRVNVRLSVTPAPFCAAIDAARGSWRRARGACGGEPRRTLRGACAHGGAVACGFVCALRGNVRLSLTPAPFSAAIDAACSAHRRACTARVGAPLRRRGRLFEEAARGGVCARAGVCVGRVLRARARHALPRQCARRQTSCVLRVNAFASKGGGQKDIHTSFI
jgi:hypothetical protein